MDEEDYACDKFIPQKWRKDVCKLCFQPKRLHEKKVRKITNEQGATLPTNHAINVDQNTDEICPDDKQKEKFPVASVPSETVPISDDESNANVTTLMKSIPSSLDTVAMKAADTGTDDTIGDETSERSPVGVSVPSATHAVTAIPLGTSQDESCKDQEHDTTAGMSLQEPEIRVDVCNSEEVVKEKTGEVKHQEILHAGSNENEGAIISNVAIISEEEEVTQDHEFAGDREEVKQKEEGQEITRDYGDREFTGDHEEVKQKEEGQEIIEDHGIAGDYQVTDDHEEDKLKEKEQVFDVSQYNDSDSEEVKHKEFIQGDHVREDTLSYEVTGPQESTGADVPFSMDISSDYSQPVIADNGAPPPGENSIPRPPPPPPVAAMAAANYPSNIPVPPPPPPIRDSSTAPVPAQRSSTLPNVPESRGMLLRDIRSGAQLKNVPWPKEKKVGEVEVTNVQTELQRMVLKRRKQEVSDTAIKLEEHKEEIDRFVKDIMEATRHSQRLVYLRMLQQQLTKFLQDYEISLEILEKRRIDWPIHQVSALQEVLEFMDKLEVRVCHVEALCQKSLSTNPPESFSSSYKMYHAHLVNRGLSFGQVNPEAVEKCTNEIVRLAKETNQTAQSRFSLATSTVQVSQTDIDSLMLRASNALVPVLDKLYEKGFASYRAAMDGTTGKFDLKFRLTNAQRLLKMCCAISDSTSMYLQIAKHIQYSEAQLKVKELQTEFANVFQVNERKGEWDTDQSVVLKASDVPRNPDSLPRKMQESYLNLQKLVKCIQSGSSTELDTMLQDVDAKLYRIIEMQLIKAAIFSKDVKVVKSVATMRGCFDDDKDLKHVHDYDWLCEAITTGFPGCIQMLVEECEVAVNAQSIDAAHTALHIAARKGDFSTVIKLLKLGADPLLVNSSHHTPLQLIAIKHFPSQDTLKTAEKEYLFDLSEYLCSTTLSDVTLVSKDGKKFPAHRLVLCAQSGYFKALLESSLWQEGQSNEVTIPSVESSILKIMLEYMYTGKCLFPRDDLNKAIELMATAEMFLLEPMRVQCETVLSGKLDIEVVVPIYQAAALYAPKRKLHCNCCHFILKNYKDIEDPDYEVLYQILESQISTS